jgi:hypothetical protein
MRIAAPTLRVLPMARGVEDLLADLIPRRKVDDEHVDTSLGLHCGVS